MYLNYILPGWGFWVIVAALYLFYSSNRSNRYRREQKKERLREKQDEVLTLLRMRDNAKEPEKKD